MSGPRHETPAGRARQRIVRRAAALAAAFLLLLLAAPPALSQTPAITISPSSATVGVGGTAELTVSLNRNPEQTIVITLISDPAGYELAGPGDSYSAFGDLEFTPANWNQPQTLTARGRSRFAERACSSSLGTSG